ncbi:hypothetical protein [Acidocella sp.]|uniref:hypothetical protein n=1 Tax=Acidocella sp. TaxID=50710 RepID=UPI003D00D080
MTAKATAGAVKVNRKAASPEEAPGRVNLRRIGLVYYVRFTIPTYRRREFGGKGEGGPDA